MCFVVTCVVRDVIVGTASMHGPPTSRAVSRRSIARGVLVDRPAVTVQKNKIVNLLGVGCFEEMPPNFRTKEQACPSGDGKHPCLQGGIGSPLAFSALGGGRCFALHEGWKEMHTRSTAKMLGVGTCVIARQKGSAGKD